jgi:hypothetical protein
LWKSQPAHKNGGWFNEGGAVSRAPSLAAAGFSL